jgi:hypothetical protein
VTLNAEPPRSSEPTGGRGAPGPGDAPSRKGLSEGVKTLVATVVAVVVIVVGVALVVTHENTRLPCVAKGAPISLVTTTTPSARPSGTLPPSRDNDAGRSRIPDSTPDADNDKLRSSLLCR